MKDETWNFSAALIDAAGWGLGMSLISHATFLPLFVGQLNRSEYAIGAISAVMYFGWFMPGLFVARAIERLPSVKRWVMGVAAVERLALFAMTPLVVLLGPAHRPGLLAAFFGCWLVMNAGVGCNTPAYYKLIARTVPTRRLGRLYGLGGALAGGLGIAGGELAGRLIERYGYPNGFAWCFAASFVVMTLSVLPLAWMREPPGVAPDAAASGDDPQALREVARDPRVRGLAVSHALFCATLMAAAFYTKYAESRFLATSSTVAHFTAVASGGEMVAYLLMGWLGDRHGNVRALQLASAAGVGAAVLALRAGSLDALYPVFLLSRLATVGWSICWVNYLLELSPPHRTASYVAVVSLALGPFRVALPLAGGFMVQRFGYAAMFGAAAVMTALSLVALLAWVPEPRAEGRDALAEKTRDARRGRDDRPAEVRTE